MSEEFTVTYTAQITKEITFDTKEEMEEWLEDGRTQSDMDLTFEKGEWSDGETEYSEGRQAETRREFLRRLAAFFFKTLAEAGRLAEAGLFSASFFVSDSEKYT